MKKAANGLSEPKRARACEVPLGPSAAFFDLFLALFLSALQLNLYFFCLLKIRPYFSGLLIFGLLLYNQKTFLRFVWNMFMYRPFLFFLVFAKITNNVLHRFTIKLNQKAKLYTPHKKKSNSFFHFEKSIQINFIFLLFLRFFGYVSL